MILGVILTIFMVLKAGRMAYRHDKAIASTKTKKHSQNSADEVSMKGIERLIEDGHIDEAADVYRTVTGIDEYAARDAIARLREKRQ